MLVTSSTVTPTVTLGSVNTVILAVFLPRPAPSQDGLPAAVDSVSP